MNKKRLYIKKMSGFFPGANSVEVLWEKLCQAQVAPSQSLASYWNFSTKKDDLMIMDRGHLADYEFNKTKFPRQIQAAIDLGKDLLTQDDHQFLASESGLVIATEWTDPSFYEAVLGLINPEEGFSVEKQIQTIREELGIKGPALAVDTACASSLYALEIARGMLESENVKSVLVMGLNMHLHSFLYRGFSKLGALSKKGALTSFDRTADGIVPGEAACGIIVDNSSLNAIAEIHAIGLSADGNEGSAFGPGLQGQLEAYRRAYEKSEVSPDQIDFLEAHGTATILGDETECTSIHQFFNRPAGRELVIGSSKSNLGHTLAASGLVSVIKGALIIQKKILPPHIPISPNTSFRTKGIKTLTQSEKLTQKKVSVGISSFGFGGSNAHVILQTPSPAPLESTEVTVQKFYIRSFEERSSKELKSPAPLLKGVAMGPKMQERFDQLQRWTLDCVQNLVASIGPDERKSLSCVMLNNLGGGLSLDFEKKYRLKQPGPELSIEGIASTLPSMLSGNSCMLFNFRGHHMLLSGEQGCLSDVLALCPYLLSRAAGDIILGVAHKNFVPSGSREALALFHITQDEASPWIASVELDGTCETQEGIDFGEATGIDKLLELLHSKAGGNILRLKNSCFKFFLRESSAKIDRKLKQKFLQESAENKVIALEYLNLLTVLTPESRRQSAFGIFLQNCEKSEGRAHAEMVVDESHPYFFDHPLDHVPGILTIHGCEELLSFYLGENYFVSSMNIRFMKFLEKDQIILLTLTEREEKGSFDFSITQGETKAGNLNVRITRKVPHAIGGRDLQPRTTEEKKFTHKNRVENVLVSALEANKNYVTALSLGVDKNEFFRELQRLRPSTLYYAEVTRQFIMLMAHLRKNIPLSSKMNLLNTEITLKEWVTPPFELHLKEFKLTQTDNFLIADVTVQFSHQGLVFGEGKIKAQVVTTEYYEIQRGEG